MISLRKIYEGINCGLFIINGRKPWGIGYRICKQKKITEVLKGGDFNPDKLPSGFGLRLDERIVEYPWLLSRLPAEKGKLLDAGSALNFDYLLSHKKISIKNLFISTLAPETHSYWWKGISYVYEDIREMCYRNNYFDWIVSLSTVEHIGLDNTMLYTLDDSKRENNPDTYLLAIKEFYRILKPGGILYISLPFGRKKNHGWLQIFDGEMVDILISDFSPTSIIENYFKYEADGWHASSREKSENETYFDIHHQKTYDDDYAAAARAIVCLELVK